MLEASAELETFIELIYQSILDETAWSMVLMSISQLFQVAGIPLFSFDHSLAQSQDYCIDAKTAVDPETLAEECAHNDASFLTLRTTSWLENEVLRFRNGLATVSPVEISSLIHDFLQNSPLLEVPFDPLAGGRVNHAMVCHSDINCNHQDDNLWQAESLQKLNMLFPHLLQAMRLRAQLTLQEQQVANNLNSLDRVPQAVLLLSASGEVHYANQRAHMLLQKTPILSIRQNKLHTTFTNDANLLNSLITKIAHANGASSKENGTLLLTRGKHHLHIQVYPVTQGYLPSGVEKRANAIMLISNQDDADLNQLTQRLTDLYQLSPTEIKVANLLWQGLSIAEIANQLTISLDGIRGHLKAIYRKTNANKQSTLIKLMYCLH